MKTIDFFLASSVTDLHEQRMELSSYFRALNDRFIEYGLYIRLHMCEYVDNNMVLTRKQDEFNDLIRGSDYFYILIWHWAGAYTLEEFGVALDQFRKTGSPIIRTYFCTMEKSDPDNPGQNIPFDPSVTAFKNRLDRELGHIYTEYSNLDTIKLKILDIAASCLEFHPETESRDTQESRKEPQDEREPNEKRSPADEKIADTYFDLANENDRNVYLRENSEKLYRDALEIYRRLAWVQPEIYDQKLAITCNNLAVLYDDTNRREEAEKLYIEALAIRRELARTQPAVYEPDLAATCNNLAALYANDASRREEAEKLFLEALTIYRRLAEAQPAVYEPDVAATCNNLAALYADDASRREEAEKLFLKALAIYRRLAEAQPAVYEPVLAGTCNNLANLYANDASRRKEAEKLYSKALAIYRELAEAQPAVYEPDVATTCNNLANLYRTDTKRREEAEKLYLEALEIRRRLARSQPAVYEPDVAMTLYNMGVMYADCGNSRKKKQFFREAKALAEKYPDDYRCARILTKLQKH